MLLKLKTSTQGEFIRPFGRIQSMLDWKYINYFVLWTMFKMNCEYICMEPMRALILYLHV